MRYLSNTYIWSESNLLNWGVMPLKKDHWQRQMGQSPLLSALQEKTRDTLLLRPGIRLETYKEGSVIHLAGEACDGAEVILSGQVVIEHDEADGQYLIVTELGPDGLIGGQVVFATRPAYPMTLMAARKTTLLLISRQALLDLLQQEDAFLMVFLSLISDNAGRLSEKIRHAARRSIRANLLAFLAKEIKRQGSRTIRLPVAKKTLAGQFGVQRTSLSRELQKMKRDGLIQYDTKTITWTSKEDP